MKDLIQKHKISAALVGGSLVIGTSLGQCVFSPPGGEAGVETQDEAPAEAPADVPADAEPAGDAGESSE